MSRRDRLRRLADRIADRAAFDPVEEGWRLMRERTLDLLGRHYGDAAARAAPELPPPTARELGLMFGALLSYGNRVGAHYLARGHGVPCPVELTDEDRKYIADYDEVCRETEERVRRQGGEGVEWPGRAS